MSGKQWWTNRIGSLTPALLAGIVVIAGMTGADAQAAPDAAKADAKAKRVAKGAKKKSAKRQGAASTVAYLLRRFDGNDDGKISRGEAPERMLKAFERIDKDKDGSLSKPELTTMVRFRNRARRPKVPLAKLPANLESIRPKNVRGQVPLKMVRTASLAKNPLTSAQIDELYAEELVAEGIDKASPTVADDVFVRRVFLDVIGRLPAPADIEEYVDDPSADKKARLVDRLLSLPHYGDNWARYWRDAIVYRSTGAANRTNPFDFETWLAERLNRNAGWNDIVAAILSARGLSTETPEGFFLAAHEAKPAELAGETARLFLGIQVSCAQCHDHPTDSWKRDQFHALASFFGKSAVRVRRDLERGPRGPIVEVAENLRRRDYRKPDLKDPSKPGEVVAPVFLTSQPLPENTSDAQRRGALATFLTSKRNPYFAKAFVNRVWAELVGYGFTNPVDDLGAEKPVAYPNLFEALAESFAASDYDIKRLMRSILLSRVYDRACRDLEDGYDEEILFRTVTPSRLTADQVYDALDWVLGNIDNGQRGGPRRPTGRLLFRSIFGFDPSIDQSEIEGSIPQALALMNSPQIHARIDARRPGTLLDKLLKTQETDQGVIRMLYLRVLARKPTADEAKTCLDYVTETGDRHEAFEDILWSLLNSTEFLNNH